MAELKFKDFYVPEAETNKFSDTPLDRLPLAMCYVPFQKFGELYGEKDALQKGTLFPILDKPFYGKFTGAEK